MSDDLNRKGPEDPKKINIHQSWELKYWASKFNVSEAQIKTAVLSVGVMVVDVKRFLGK
jgi:hypothetical protein